MVEDKDSRRPTDAMAAIDEGAFGDATIIEERLGPGTVVGGYEIDAELGRGTMGVVYAATHPVIGKRVAIKVLRQLGDPAAIERFVLEARAVNEIGHRNIVDIFDFGALPDGREYLVMDLLVGETLGGRLARGPLTLVDAATIANECASALAAAHAKGIVHRDLKPDNVFLVDIPNTRRIAVKVLDFGLVKLVNKVDSGVRTKTGAVVGTADYMSPEQGRGRDVDHRTDIYALGIMTFQMLTGRLPYPRDSFLEALVAHAEEPVPSLLSIMPSAPRQLAQLIEAMMAKDRYKRPNLTGIRAVLRKFKAPDSAPMEATAIAAIPPAPPPAPRPIVHGNSMLDTLRGPGVGATPSRPVPALTTADVEESRRTSERARVSPAAAAEARSRGDFVPISTPVVAIPIGAQPVEPGADDEPIDPPTLIAVPIDPARVTPRAAAPAVDFAATTEPAARSSADLAAASESDPVDFAAATVLVPSLAADVAAPAPRAAAPNPRGLGTVDDFATTQRVPRVAGDAARPAVDFAASTEPAGIPSVDFAAPTQLASAVDFAAPTEPAGPPSGSIDIAVLTPDGGVTVETRKPIDLGVTAPGIAAPRLPATPPPAARGSASGVGPRPALGGPDTGRTHGSNPVRTPAAGTPGLGPDTARTHGSNPSRTPAAGTPALGPDTPRTHGSNPSRTPASGTPAWGPSAPTPGFGPAAAIAPPEITPAPATVQIAGAPRWLVITVVIVVIAAIVAVIAALTV